MYTKFVRVHIWSLMLEFVFAKIFTLWDFVYTFDSMYECSKHSCPKHVVIEKKSPSNFDNKIVDYSHQTTIFH